MFNWITAKIALYGAIALAVAAVLFGVRQSGKSAQKINQLEIAQKQAKVIHEETKKANAVANRVATDPDYRQRVRDRFDDTTNN